MKEYDIVIKPILTEKSYADIANKKYTFMCAKDANKVEIKQAVEAIFNVKVVDVNTIRVLPKRRRVGKYEGYRSAYKKAICTLAEGQKINEFDI